MATPEIAGSLEVTAGGERLVLLPQRAAYWPRLGTLLIADAHLGKAAAFRRAGVPVPSGTTAEDLERLGRLIAALDARRVVFLGDLVHDSAAQKAAAADFRRWRARHASVDIVLVRGNHDRRAGRFACDWGIECVEEPHAIEGIALTHAPRAVPGAYALAGHLHPAAHLFGRDRDSLRLPCFWLTPDYAVLPAFGAFTGMADVAGGAHDRLYVVAGDRVMPLR